MMKKVLALLLGCLMVLALTACSGKGDDKGKPAATKFPEKNITIIVPYPAGGSTDLTMRTLAEQMKQQLGKNVVILNKEGGGGSVGAAECAVAKADGYTLTVANAANMSIVPRMANISYTFKDFTPISRVSNTPLALSVRKDFPANNLKEWMEWAKANPGKMRFGSAGANSTQQLTLNILSNKEGFEATHIAFNGAGPAVAGILGGHVETVVALVTDVVPNTDAGELKTLVVFSDKRVPELPNVPCSKELGYDDLSFGVWYALIGPKGMPQDVVEILDSNVKKALDSDFVKESYKKLKVNPAYMDNKELSASMTNVDKMFGEVLEQIKAKAKK